MGKCGIVAIAKNEEKYIKDWALYHFKLGFDEIFVIDNNDLDNDNQIKVITELQKSNYKIYPVDARGREKLESLGFQEGTYFKTYQYIKKNHKDIEWIAFIDLDEYFDFDGLTVKEFVNQDKFKMADLIHINWKLYGDNEQIYYEDRPVIERFTKPAPIDAVYNTHIIGKGFYFNMHIKSLVRVTDKEFVFCSPHTVVFKEESKCMNVSGGIEDGKLPFQNICWTGGHLKHFITKSTEEFIQRKLLNNPRADSKTEISVYNEEIESYFNINTKTHTKLSLIDRYNNLKVKK
jgi:hypothetical protein